LHLAKFSVIVSALALVISSATPKILATPSNPENPFGDSFSSAGLMLAWVLGAQLRNKRRIGRKAGPEGLTPSPEALRAQAKNESTHCVEQALASLVHLLARKIAYELCDSPSSQRTGAPSLLDNRTSEDSS
jgi:hypothetical protein